MSWESIFAYFFQGTFLSLSPVKAILEGVKKYLPAEQEPVLFGTHGAVAKHYKVPPAVLEPHATTLDYIVAATAG